MKSGNNHMYSTEEWIKVWINDYIHYFLLLKLLIHAIILMNVYITIIEDREGMINYNVQENRDISIILAFPNITFSLLIGYIVTSSNGNIFCVIGPLCGEFTGHRWIPLSKASDGELWCLFDLCLNKRLSK